MFLWQGAELGLVGLGVFLWILAAAFYPVLSRLRAHRSDLWFLGIVAGLVACVVTWLAWQVMYPQVAYTFWILLGVAIAHVARDAPDGVTSRRRPLLGTVGIVMMIVVVICSVPMRARREIARLNVG